jgi:hypothetical protein
VYSSNGAAEVSIVKRTYTECVFPKLVSQRFPLYKHTPPCKTHLYTIIWRILQGGVCAYNGKRLAQAAAHQSAMLVPLIAGMSGPPLDGQGKCTGRNRAGAPAYLQNETVGALGALFDWAKSETRVAGFCPWHFNNRCGTALPPTKCHDAKPPCDMDLGAVSLPFVKAKLEEIGRYIVNKHRSP